MIHSSKLNISKLNISNSIANLKSGPKNCGKMADYWNQAGLPEFFNANIPKFRNKYTNSPKNIPKFLKILTQYIQLKKLILPCSK